MTGSAAVPNECDLVIPPCRGVLAAATDTLGRVLLVDVAAVAVVRLFKGCRDAQCGWLLLPPPPPLDGDTARDGAASSGANPCDHCCLKGNPLPSLQQAAAFEADCTVPVVIPRITSRTLYVMPVRNISCESRAALLAHPVSWLAVAMAANPGIAALGASVASATNIWCGQAMLRDLVSGSGHLWLMVRRFGVCCSLA